MKIYGNSVYENERADLVGLAYIEYSLNRVQQSVEWLKKSDDTCQYLLAEIDMLITLGDKFPKDINLKLKKSDVIVWKDVFYIWYDKNLKKIPSEYRISIKDNAENLFHKLEKFGHSLDWL